MGKGDMKSLLDGSVEKESYEHHRHWVEPRAQFDDIGCVYSVVYRIAPNISYVNEK